MLYFIQINRVDIFVNIGYLMPFVSNGRVSGDEMPKGEDPIKTAWRGKN